MISNEQLRKIDAPGKLQKLFEAFGLKSEKDQIAFLDEITHHVTGQSGVIRQDLEVAIRHFLKHEWQRYQE